MSLSLFTKLITTSRTIKNSGYNLEGQLDNDDKNIELYIKEPVIRNVLMMDRSTYHTIYITSDRNIYATGYNEQGQLGIGTNDNAYKITKVILPSYRDITKVICGGYHTFFLTKDGEAYATGYNAFGQLGLNHKDNVFTPVKVDLKNIKDIYCGGYHTFFLMKSGEVYACGKNDYGQLGLPLSESIIKPTKVNSLTGTRYVSCGGDFNIFLTKDNNFLVAGYNGYGQLGDGTYNNANTVKNINSSLPAEVKVKDIEKIECGSHHTLILLSNRNVYGTGSNMYGQLGLGKNKKDSNVFVQLNVQGIQNIVTDAYSSIFQVDTKILYGCGHNKLGELGLGDNIHRYEIVRLNYTDIWLDSLNEDIIITPELDFGKNLFVIDGYFLTGVQNFVIVLDKDLNFRVFNKYSMEELDKYYFYIERGKLKFTKNRNLVFNEDGSRKFDVEPRFEVCNKPFINDKETLEFTINNKLFSYNTKTMEMKELYSHKRLCTSIANNMAVFGGDFINIDNLSKVFTNYMNQPKIEFQVYQLLSINIANYKYAFTYYEFKHNEQYKTYTKYKIRLAFIDSNNKIILAEDETKVKSHDSRELFSVTSLTFNKDILYIGTSSGQLWIVNTDDNKILNLRMIKKFKGGQILSLKIKDSNNELSKDLLIDTNSRYLLLGFSDGRYLKYPLYKVPEVNFKCTGLYFIDDKVYYNIKIKLSNFDYTYHKNIRFLLHNTYNELEIPFSEFDSNLELEKTVVFEKIALSTYTYLRLNYIYGNNTLGSVFQRIPTLKINLAYLNERKLIVNLSNYSSYDVDIILQSYDEIRNSSKDIEKITINNIEDHQFIYFKEIDKEITHINLLARYGDSDEYIMEHVKLEDIDFKYIITQTGYNDEILLNFNRLFNRIYENKMIDDVSFDLMQSLLNGMSHKKFESINSLDKYKVDKSETKDSYGNFMPIFSDTKSNHYKTTSNPKNVRYRDHYRGNVFINGLKVPYKDVMNIFDMHDGLFTSYYRDKTTGIQKNNNLVDISMYSESLILGEKELYTIYLNRFDTVIDKLLSIDGYDFYVPAFSDYLDTSYIQVYIKFRHGVYWSRINDRNYEIMIKERHASYTVFNLKMYNEVLLKLGGEIHICLNDLDKRNSYIFKDTASNEIGRYKNYYVPLITLNENGSLITYYTEKSENIEVFADGHMLTPYIDYKVVNLPLHLQIPTMVLFKKPINNDKKIEISIMKENYLDSYVRDYTKKTLSDTDTSKTTLNIFEQSAFNPMLENLFDVYVNGYKIPSKYNTDNRSFNMIQTLKGIPKENRIDYVRFYLEDNEVVRFLITLLSLKLIRDTSLKENPSDNSGDISKETFYNSIEYKPLEELYTDLDKENDGLLYFLFELVDNSFLKEKDAIIDCNDKNQLEFGSDVTLDGTRLFRLPYIQSNIKIDSNIDYAREFFDNEVKELLNIE